MSSFSTRTTAAHHLKVVKSPLTRQIDIRKPSFKDAKEIWQFVRDCGHLDLNSPYHYYMMCRDFAETSIVAEQDGQIIAYCSAYLRPNDPRTLFVWQIGVAADRRGMALGQKLLCALIDRCADKSISHLEATIALDNKAAEGLFNGVANQYRASLLKSSFLEADDFPGPHHSEILLRIGPLNFHHK